MTKPVLTHYYTSEEYTSMGLSGGGKKICLGIAMAVLDVLSAVREKIIPGLKVPFCVFHGTHDLPVPISW